MPRALERRAVRLVLAPALVLWGCAPNLTPQQEWVISSSIARRNASARETPGVSA